MSSVPCFSLPFPVPRPAHQNLSKGSRTDNATKKRKRSTHRTHQGDEQESAAPRQHRVSWRDDDDARSPHAPDPASSPSGPVFSPAPGHGDRSSRDSASRTQDPHKEQDDDGEDHHDSDDEHEAGQTKRKKKKKKERKTKRKEKEKHKTGPKIATSKQHTNTLQIHLSSLRPPLLVPETLIPVPRRRPLRRHSRVVALPYSRLSRPMDICAPSLRQQHLEVVTTIMYRSLLDGDYCRARRAWAMMLRSHARSPRMDIREAGRWGIGAEVLLRQDQTEMTDDDEGQRRGRQGRTNNDGEDTYSDAYEDEEHTGGDGHDDRDDDWRGQKKQSKTPPSTTRQDFDSAGEYYERLILQYSSQQATHFSNKANAMDFALAMFGLWIHHSTQHRRTLSSVADAGADAGEEEEEEEEEEDADETHEIRQSRYGFRGESHYDSHDKNPENRLDEPSSRYRHSNSKSRRSSAQARTSARNNDQSARQQMAELRDAKEIEARMHKMMLSPPYCDSAEMSRLRSMIALWIDHLREMVSGEQEVVEMEVEVEEEEEREVKEEEEDEIWG